ncbi:MAG: ArsA family ATPase [Oligoflexales bacterium]
MTNELEKLIDRRKTIILLGSGGVGKTSCSLGVAILAARQGKKVGLLSIDPAKRLASAMGISLGSNLKTIEFGKHLEMKGRLDAAMLDQKAVFDSMVKKHAPSPETAEKILEHPIYIAASTKLAGPGEYMALAKLQEMIESKEFDLIVLDTPPDTHALEFLSRPNILSGFMENKVMNWLIKPFHVAKKIGVNKLLTVGERLMGGLTRVTGIQALSVMTEFLVLMQQVIEGFHKSGEKLLETLHSKETGFILVTSCNNGALRSARNLAEQLVVYGYALDGIIFNKCMSLNLGEELSAYMKESSAGKTEAPHFHCLLETLHQVYKREKDAAQYYVNLLNKNYDLSPFMIKVPERLNSLHSLEEIYRFSFAFNH